jgi:hypothetical protein
MPRKPKPPPDDPEQSKRFIKAAREIGADENPEAFERVFGRVVRPTRLSPKPAVGRSRRIGKLTSS